MLSLPIPALAKPRPRAQRPAAALRLASRIAMQFVAIPIAIQLILWPRAPARMNGADEGRDEILGDLGSKSEATRQPKSRKAGCWPKAAMKGIGVKSKRLRRGQTALIQIGVDRAVRRKEIAFRLPTL